MLNNKFNKGGKQLSSQSGLFWNTDCYQLGNGDLENIALGVYGDKVTLNFTKGNNKNPEAKKKTSFLSMDYESADIVARTLTYIEMIRKECIKNNVECPIWSFKNTLQFTDKDNTLRTIGVFEIRTDISPVTQKNTVYISYMAGTEKFEVALGSMYLKDQCEFSDKVDIDANDSRFYAFADMFRGIVLNWGTNMQQQKMFAIIMSNFNAIRGKMGIPAKTDGGHDGKYTDSNYSSAPSSDSFADDVPAGDLSDLAANDEPF